MEDPHEKVRDAPKVGDPLEASLQESLMVLADRMATRQERKTHDEVDRELGLSLTDDPDCIWCDHDSATNRLHHGEQVQRDLVKPTPEIRMGMEGYDQGPPATSCLHSPKDIWAVSVDGLQPPITGLLSEKDMVGASLFNTQPAIAPSGETTFRRASPAPVTHPVLQPKANISRLPTGAGTFLDNTARIRDLGVLEGKIQHISMEGHMQRHDGDGGGFAVARARQRLHSFRTARNSVSTDVNVMHRHDNALPRQLPAGQHMVPPSQEESKQMLGKLKEMRYSLHAT